MLYVGIDVAKHKHDFAVLGEQGEILIKNKYFPSSHEGFVYLHKQLQQQGDTCLIALEDTGHYAFNSLLIKEFVRSTTLRKTKTDTKDALMIALRLLSDPNRGQFRTRDNDQTELKILSRHVSRLTQPQTRSKVQHTRLLGILFPELTKVLGKGSTHHRYVYELIRLYPSPKKILNAGFDEIIKIKRLTTKHALDILKGANAKVYELMERLDSVITTVKGIGHRFGSVIHRGDEQHSHLQKSESDPSFCRT